MGWTYLDTSILRGISLFENVGERGLQELLVLMTTHDFKAGHHVFKEGEPGDALYLILKGEVRISKMIPGVGEEALAFLPAGSCFGEMALVEGRLARSASAICNTDCELAKLSRVDFLEMIKRDKDLGMDILWGFVQMLSRRLRDSNDKVAFLAMSNMFE